MKISEFGSFLAIFAVALFVTSGLGAFTNGCSLFTHSIEMAVIGFSAAFLWGTAAILAMHHVALSAKGQPARPFVNGANFSNYLAAVLTACLTLMQIYLGPLHSSLGSGRYCWSITAIVDHQSAAISSPRKSGKADSIGAKPDAKTESKPKAKKAGEGR